MSRAKNKLLLAVILIISIGSFLTLFSLFIGFPIKPFKSELSSMVPTILPQDKVLVNRLAYSFSSPMRGDIVVIDFKDTPEYLVILRRIVALENDKIEINAGSLYLNGKKVEEGYVKFKDYSNFGPLKIPKDHVFVMGDNRPNSKDSRSFGPVKKSDILGRVFFVYLPLTAVKTL